MILHFYGPFCHVMFHRVVVNCFRILLMLQCGSGNWRKFMKSLSERKSKTRRQPPVRNREQAAQPYGSNDQSPRSEVTP